MSIDSFTLLSRFHILRHSVRWVISAAHCFCALNEHVQCTLINRGFDKKLLEVDEIYGKNFNERCSSQILKSPFHRQDQCDLWLNGYSTEEGPSKGRLIVFNLKTFFQGIKIAEVIIHPDYWSDKTKHGNSYDLALIQMDQVLCIGNGTMG